MRYGIFISFYDCHQKNLDEFNPGNVSITAHVERAQLFMEVVLRIISSQSCSRLWNDLISIADSKEPMKRWHSMWQNYAGYLHNAIMEIFLMLLQDRFVCVLKSEATQKKLLAEVDFKFARAVEIVGKCYYQMQSSMDQTASVHTTEDVCNIQCSGHKKEGMLLVWEPRTYRPSYCPFKEAKCHNCGKIGHIQPACRQLKKKTA